MVELTDQLTLEDDPVPRSVRACSTRHWRSSSADRRPRAFLRGFELQLLSRAGFEPQLDRCTRCDRAWTEDAQAHLSFSHGYDDLRGLPRLRGVGE